MRRLCISKPRRSQLFFEDREDKALERLLTLLSSTFDNIKACLKVVDCPSIPSVCGTVVKRTLFSNMKIFSTVAMMLSSGPNTNVLQEDRNRHRCRQCCCRDQNAKINGSGRQQNQKDAYQATGIGLCQSREGPHNWEGKHSFGHKG